MKRILFQVTDSDYDKINKYAKETGDTMTGVIRAALVKYFELASGRRKSIDAKLYKLLMYRYELLIDKNKYTE